MPDMYVDADSGQPVNPGQGVGGFVPQFQKQATDKADLLEKIRPDAIVEVIKNKLLGKDYNPSTQQWEINEAVQDLALTEMGAGMIANLMLTASSQNVSLSNLKDKEIKERVRRISKTAIYMAVVNCARFGIKNRSQIHFINDIVFTNTLVVLKQPENEGIRKLLSHTLNENHNTSRVEQPRQGMFSGILGGGRRR